MKKKKLISIIRPWAVALVMLLLAEAVASFCGNGLSGAGFLLAKRLYSPLRVPWGEERTVQWQVHSLLNHKKPVDMLFSGDCSALLGVDPEIITRHTGLSAWNGATLGVLTTQGHAEILELYLKYVGAPKIFVYSVSTYVLSRPRDDPWLSHFHKWISPVLNRESPGRPMLYTLREIVQNRIVNPFFPDSYLESITSARTSRYYGYSDKDLRRISESNFGYLPRLEDDKILAETGSSEIEGVYNNAYTKGLKKIFELSSKYKFDVLIALHPYPVFAKTAKTKKTMTNVDMNLKKKARYHRNVKFAPTCFYPDNHYSAFYHFNERGAKRFSNDIAKIINNMDWGPQDRFVPISNLALNPSAEELTPGNLPLHWGFLQNRGAGEWGVSIDARTGKNSVFFRIKDGPASTNLSLTLVAADFGPKGASNLMAFEPRAIYNISFYAKGSVSNMQVNLLANEKDTPADKFKQVPLIPIIKKGGIVLGKSWKKYSGIFKTSDKFTEGAVVFSVVGGDHEPGEILFIDDLVVEQCTDFSQQKKGE